jgi:hypothetical protein
MLISIEFDFGQKFLIFFINAAPITGIGSWDSGFCNLLWKHCSNNGHCLWASGEHIMLSSKLHLQSGLIWYVAVKKWTGYQTSGHCIRASPGSTQRSDIQLHMQFGFILVWQWFGKS